MLHSLSWQTTSCTKEDFSPLLRCVDSQEARYVQVEIHEGICKSQSDKRIVARKVFRVGLLMAHATPRHALRDVLEFAKKYENCLVFALVQNFLPEPLTSITIQWLFAQSGIHLVGLLSRRKGVVKSVPVAINYFPKQAKVKPLTTITTTNCKASFFVKFIIVDKNKISISFRYLRIYSIDMYWKHISKNNFFS